ncbi:hypothetical protein DV515_00011070 [Chloebia gouldiae]|uniref:Reverse transcriptase zinc-binding domain-containing protein n=1 Tax=Chloebia gouldiae TaxID=44316 RepID=A0A3L8S852_CHLGU|nr:hypothetical protein DV515_00011070 [Chloebia gouldiae]
MPSGIRGIRAGGDKESIPLIWDPIPSVESGDGGEEGLSVWEAAAPQVSYPRPRNWRKLEFKNWTQLVAQGHGIENFEDDDISNAWIREFSGIPHRKLVTALQLRASVYPTREFLARGRHEAVVRSCRHCGADSETVAHNVGNCPITQDARIKRHNAICDMLSQEAKKEDWTVFHEPHLRDDNNELFKQDVIMVKGLKAYVVDVTVRYEHNTSSLRAAAAEKAKKYQRLHSQIKELTNVVDIVCIGFPMGVRGKWYNKNSEFLLALGLPKSRLGRIARALTFRVLVASVEIVHIFVNKARSIVRSGI